MKIISKPEKSYFVELSYDEIVGILKMIGNTSIRSRCGSPFNLTPTQSEKLADIYREHIDEFDHD